MKKLLLACFLIFLLFNGYSQKYLTNRQVYNFSVGDVYEAIGTTYSSHPPIYYLTKILSKQYSTKLDSIIYIDSVYTFSPNSCMTCTDSTYTAQVQTQIMTQLDSSAITDTITVQNCNHTCNPGYYDSIYIDSQNYCGKRVYERIPPKCVDSCFEPITNTYEVIEGCGGVYNSYNDPTMTDRGAYYLFYYKKHDTVCGSYRNIIAGINNLVNPFITLNIYPNPVTASINVNTSCNTITSYIITDIAGRLIYSAEFNNGQAINVQNLPAGQYLLEFYTKNSGTVIKRFYKE